MARSCCFFLPNLLPQIRTFSLPSITLMVLSPLATGSYLSNQLALKRFPSLSIAQSVSPFSQWLFAFPFLSVSKRQDLTSQSSGAQMFSFPFNSFQCFSLRSMPLSFSSSQAVSPSSSSPWLVLPGCLSSKFLILKPWPESAVALMTPCTAWQAGTLPQTLPVRVCAKRKVLWHQWRSRFLLLQHTGETKQKELKEWRPLPHVTSTSQLMNTT